MVALIAASVQHPAVWYVFVVLCGLQGLYVFAAFVCNARVFDLYRHALCGSKGQGREAIGEETTGVETTHDEIHPTNNGKGVWTSPTTMAV
jgi:hypothetical protein